VDGYGSASEPSEGRQSSGPYPCVMDDRLPNLGTPPRPAVRPNRTAENETVSAEHYFTSHPQAPGRPTEVVFTLAGHEYRLAAAGGVFSAGRLDPGTAVLLRKADLPSGDGTLLDLGCGYGPIACVLANVAPRATVYAVDVNTRALELVRANAARLGLADRVVAATPDGVPPDVRFTQIWSNPPIRVGKSELHALLGRWLPRLQPDGTAWLVVARNLGADSLAQWLTEHGWTVVRHASQQGFRVLRLNRGDGSTPDEGDS
jgi:16S rRNA (guanine1207-N2)-methyltransferase